jgi:hypothetical protein
MNYVAIQQAMDTGRFHPALYLLAPFPGGGARYTSRMHHTEGFERVEDAQVKARELAEEMGAPVQGPFGVIAIETAGPDVLLREALA